MLYLRAILLGMFVTMISHDNAAARSPDRAAVRVHCMAADLPVRQVRSLCQQMVQSLSQVLPRAALRQVAAAEWKPRRARDVSVRLELSEQSGKLLWQIGPAGELHTGPALPFHTKTTTKTPHLRAFTDDLVASTRPMLAATLK